MVKNNTTHIIYFQKTIKIPLPTNPRVKVATDRYDRACLCTFNRGPFFGRFSEAKSGTNY